jgi:enamine deaminase RidA (YjgF/YER057c/UK114 family)
MTRPRILQPPHWPRPSGYANGIAAEGITIFLGGQIGWNEHGQFAEGMAAQVAQALRNIVTVLAEAGAEPTDLVRLTWYVADMDAYRNNLAPIGEAYRSVLGRHYPVMSVVEVRRLVEKAALVEIEATAVLPRPG